MIIAIVNHKGGTGKTTTTINLGSALAAQGYRVLLVDFDAQGSLSYALGLDDTGPTIAEAILGDVDPKLALQQREAMDILPAGRALADVELAIARAEGRMDHLRNLLSEFHGYDFVLIDCPPSLSLLTLNALNAADAILVPMQMDVLALRGLDSMLETVKSMRAFNPDLQVLGVLPIMVTPHKKIYREITSYIMANYGVRLFKHAIHNSVKAAEAPSFGKSVMTYAPASSTASDYREFARELASLTQLCLVKKPAAKAIK